MRGAVCSYEAGYQRPFGRIATFVRAGMLGGPGGLAEVGGSGGLDGGLGLDRSAPELPSSLASVMHTTCILRRILPQSSGLCEHATSLLPQQIAQLYRLCIIRSKSILPTARTLSAYLLRSA